MERFYGSNEMAKIGCHNCNGCSSCCQDMGQSIWLDPYDIYHLCKGLSLSFEELLKKTVELHVEDGLILPNLRMIQEQCGYLNTEGRCSIHSFRPGFCRLFPLGRNYENGTLQYFILQDACPIPNKSKVKIDKWLQIPKIKDYETFLVTWHGLTKGLRLFYHDNSDNEAITKAINMRFLQIFYLSSYDTNELFYPQFTMRMEEMSAFLHQLGIVNIVPSP